MNKENNKFAFNSFPMDFNLDTPDNEMIAVCEKHNNAIEERYSNWLKDAKKTMCNFDHIVSNYSLPLEKLQLSQRQLIESTGVFKRILFEKIDLGVTIDGKENTQIISSYLSMKEYLLSAIDLISSYRDTVEVQILTRKEQVSCQTKGTEIKFEDLNFEMKPRFNSEAVPTLFDLLKDFFIEKHQKQLYQILISGDDSNEQLIFSDNGNRLADAFRRAYEVDIIIGCEKKELEHWICRNFKFRYRKQIKFFTADYTEKCISRNDQPCKNPILKIENGQIIKMDSREGKKYNKY